ncbi:MAG: flagellar hook protein FlgE [Azospirillaceae bacterium]|nr:flagellar hook protein FlgE [Azospirillaceae bacterium]
MSLLGALHTGVAGLSAFSQELTNISNNITNMSTTAYKSSNTNFADLITTANGAANASSGGVTTTTSTMVTTQGNIQQTSSTTDVAISGNGFFVVESGTASTTSNVLYTRDGSFSVNTDGYLVNADGYTLMGWKLKSNALPTSTSDTSSLTPINVSSSTGTVEQTNTVDMNMNLDSSSTALAVGTVPSEYTRDVTVYDSLGTAQTVALDFYKTGSNAWTMQVTASGATSGTTTDVTMTFNSDGSIATIGGTAVPPYNAAVGPIDWGNGSDTNQTLTLNLSSMTQYSSSFAATSVTQNGAAMGTLKSVSVDTSGNVVASYSNGTTQNIYQIALATFSDPNGLQSVSGNVYKETQYSGTYNLQVSGTNSAGSINPSSLEQSNVDLGTELTDMIVTQRAYSAASKIVTTTDSMLQTLLSMT